MADISIPGVSDKYKTNDLVKSLVEVEKIPLKREQDKIEGYKFEQENWRRVNQFMGALRESARGLFSFNNPFSDKQPTSSDPSVLTVTANRDAGLGSHKVEIKSLALADSFLSGGIDKNYIVPQGNYIFNVGDKNIKFVWKGGVINDFVDSLNKRSTNILKASLVGANSDQKNLLLESQITGEKNKLSFQEDGITFAENIGMIAKKTVSNENIPLGKTIYDLEPVQDWDFSRTVLKRDELHVASKNAVSILVTNNATQKNAMLFFTVDQKDATSATSQEIPAQNILPNNQNNLDGVDSTELTQNIPEIENAGLDFSLPAFDDLASVEKMQDPKSFIFLRLKDGSEVSIGTLAETDQKQNFEIPLKEYGDISGIIVKNKYENKTIVLSDIFLQPSQEKESEEIVPVNPISKATDAVLKYQGITMIRPSNTIDDIIPHLTLNLEGLSEKPVIIDIKSNTEAAKDSLITFVGQYNRLITEINILTQSNPAIIAEIEYFTKEEQDAAAKRLGLFQGDFSLTNNKSTLQNLVSAAHAQESNRTYTMLSQIGISTKSSASAVTASQLRGYLEIDEKKLDKALAENINEVRTLFGYDSTGDLVVDSGLAVQIDKNLHSYLQLGGILASKTQGVESKITASQTSIKRLERQIESKEAELRRKYGQMEGTLRNLEGQSNSISNFNKSQSNSN